MRAFVRVPETNHVMTVHVSDGDTVAMLKGHVERSKQTTIAADNMSLFFFDRLLKDGEVISEIVPDNHIHVVLRRTQLSDVNDLLFADESSAAIQPSAGADIHISATFSIRLNAKISCDVVLSHIDTLFELHGAKDLPCPCQYTVIINGFLISCRNVFLSVQTQAIGPVRVVARQALRDNAMLVSLSRQISLYLELIGCIAVRMNTLPACITELVCKNEQRAFKIKTDVDVSLIMEGDVVEFVLGPVPAPEPAPKRLPANAFFNAEYIQEHWVSAASGYYAVVGKMSEEEENKLLLDVVSAFSDVDNVDPAISCELAQRMLSHNEPLELGGDSTKTLSLDSKESHETAAQKQFASDATMSFISPELLVNPWTTGLQAEEPSLHLFTAAEVKLALKGDSELSEQLFDAWRTAGFVLFEFDDDQMALLDAIFAEAAQYFEHPQAYKDSCTSHEVYFGYQRRAEFDKELFQVRCAPSDIQCAWPSQQPSLKTVSKAAFKSLNKLCQQFTRLVTQRACKAEAIPELEEDMSFDNAESISLSNMTLFHYSIPDGYLRNSVHCPYHTDVSMVTVIPKSRGTSNGGLHVWHYGLSQWLDIEGTGAPRNLGVLLAGESLSFLTNNAILGGLHEVSLLRGERYSIPFQSVACAEAVLNPRDFVADGFSERVEPITSKAFVHKISAQRISSNFPREEVYKKLKA